MLNLNSQHMVIILIVFCALVFGMCASITISCWSKIEERRQRKREYKLRRSRETSMEAGLDRTMTITSLDHAAGGGGGGITASGMEHLEQGSSSSGSRCRKIITANQIRAVSGHKDMMIDEDGCMIDGGGPGGGGPTMAFYDSEENGCYVPDMDMSNGGGGGGGGSRHHHLVYPADHRRPNGGLSYSLEKYSPDTPTPPHHHQTQVVQQQAQQMLTSPNGQSVVGMGPREYYQPGGGGGDHGSIRSDSECSIPPPPPPPALSHFRNRLTQVGVPVGPQTYRTMPLDASKLNDGSGAGLVMGDNPTLYRHAQHGNMPQRMLHHPGQQGPGLQQQHHPDCAQHQLNKQQHMMQPSADSGYNSNSLRRGTATPTVVSYAYRGTPTTGDVLGPDDIDIMVEEGGNGGGNGTQAVPGHHRSNLELTDDGLDMACDMFSDSEMVEPGGRGSFGNGRLVASGHQQRAPYLMRTQSTMEEEEVEGLDEEESSSMPLATNGAENGQYTTLTPGHNARPVYYRSEAVIEMGPNQTGAPGSGPINSNLSSSTSNLRQGVAMMR